MNGHGMQDRTLPPLKIQERAHHGAWSEVASGRQLLVLVSMLWFFNVAICWPGALLDDSVRQYQEALSGRYTDWHPPVMAWLWAHLRPFGEGPGPIFTLHLAMYWTGIGAIADAMRRL